MNIIKINKRFFIIDGILLKFELDTSTSCKRCYYNGLDCDMEGHVLCVYLKINENYESSDDMHYLQPVKSLILSSKIRNEYNKSK